MPVALTQAQLAVLVVDDEPDWIRLLETMAESESDFAVVASATSSTGLFDLVATHRPDVVILDHMLSAPPAVPVPTRRAIAPRCGLELVEHVRFIVPDATIVIFSGRSGLATSASNVGADLYIEKPNAADLFPAIRASRAER